MRSIPKSVQSGIVFDIQRASLQDGPGLRTTVFLKGCPLRCAWCHNPESWRMKPETGNDGKQYGREMTVDEVMDVVLSDRSFYETSDGGLTVSGGEPTIQFGFCLALLKAARNENIHTCLDTCGYLQSELLDRIMPWLDLFHFDFKISETSDHKKWTGVDCKCILENLHKVCSCGKQVILRCPIIPGVNDHPKHFEAIAELMKRYPDNLEAEILPYHKIGASKYANLNLQNRQKMAFREPTDTELQSWRDQL